MATSKLLNELASYNMTDDRDLFVESKAVNAIVAAMNVMTLIDESYSEEEAEELRRRLMNSIKNKDPKKFQRKIREIRKKNGQ